MDQQTNPQTGQDAKRAARIKANRSQIAACLIVAASIYALGWFGVISGPGPTVALIVCSAAGGWFIGNEISARQGKWPRPRK